MKFERAVNPLGPGVEEEFKIIPGYSRYRISQLGRLRVLSKSGCLTYMNPWLTKWGYLQIKLVSDDGNTKHQSLHRLIATTWLPNNKSFKTDINHKNGIKTDNRITNLEWVSKSENTQHAHTLGLCKSSTGNNHWSYRMPDKIWRKLTKEQVIEIVQRRKCGEAGRALAREFRVSHTAIRAIMHGINCRQFTKGEIGRASCRERV